ncbi:hypothetical protein CRUP_012424 [Coryphaenoides rupestris]|nr:hypothetical protein CRUP_012424 [Coryphaenoides rupestris]
MKLISSKVPKAEYVPNIIRREDPSIIPILYNKVATFAKVEKEDDMIQFWLRLSRLMSKLNPDPNLIHIMGCYVLGSANGEKDSLPVKPNSSSSGVLCRLTDDNTT